MSTTSPYPSQQLLCPGSHGIAWPRTFHPFHPLINHIQIAAFDLSRPIIREHLLRASSKKARILTAKDCGEKLPPENGSLIFLRGYFYARTENTQETFCDQCQWATEMFQSISEERNGSIRGWRTLWIIDWQLKENLLIFCPKFLFSQVMEESSWYFRVIICRQTFRNLCVDRFL